MKAHSLGRNGLAVIAILLAACADTTDGAQQSGTGFGNGTVVGAPGAPNGTGGVGAPGGVPVTGSGGAASTPAAGSTGFGSGGAAATTGTGGMSAGVAGMMSSAPAGTGGMSATTPAVDAGMGSAPAGGGDVSSCPPAPAGADPAAVTALDTINMLRLAVGDDCDTMAVGLNASAQNHCDYYAMNASMSDCIADPHAEVMSCPGYTGADIGTRMQAAGYTGRGSSEVMAFNDDPARAIQQWVNSVWHRIPILDPWTTELGYGHATGCDTIDFGRGTPMPDDTVVVYPYNGQTGVPTDFDGSHEGPMPPAPPTGWPSASPINIYAKSLMVADHVLTIDGDTTPIDHVWLTSADSQFLRDGAMLYANAPFAAQTTYRVHITGTYVGGDLNLEWTFTTGAATMRWGQP